MFMETFWPRGIRVRVSGTEDSTLGVKSQQKPEP